MVKAIVKVLWIQKDIFAKWYVRGGEEFRGRKGRRRRKERRRRKVGRGTGRRYLSV